MILEPILETRHLTHTYSMGTPFQRDALTSVDFTVYPGEYLGVIGHTGSGKSTLIQHLNGLLKPTSGTVLFQGQDIWAAKERTRQIRFQVGLVFQYPEYQLFEETVYKDIAFGPANMGLDGKEIDRRVRQAAEFVGLKEATLEKSPFELSGGQKRRAAIAGVLAMAPQVLILDEPTAGLDPKGREEILRQIKELQAQTGMTILLVSHSMEDVAEYVDRIVVMNKGKVMYDGAPKEVFAHYKELEEVGLAAPQVTYILHALKDRGFDVDVNATTTGEAVETVLHALGRIPEAFRP